jgi:hypothetical protein
MKLDELMINVLEAHKGMKAELQRRWPEKSRVDVMLSRRQVNASPGTVIGHDGRNGTIRVSIDRKPDFYGRYRKPFVRDIHYLDVVIP